jgi:phosphoribosylamine--glycine ligase
MKVLVIGSGGREHAIAATLAKSPKVTEIHCAPGNGGISAIASCHDVKATDISGVINLADKLAGLSPGETGTRDEVLIFVAPDDPLVMGMVDALNEAGFKTFGPRRNAAILEGSKEYSKDFMKRHNIPTAGYETFTDCYEAIHYVQNQNKYPAVIKCDGLALGKGVVIAENEEEAIEAIRSMLVDSKFGDSGKKIVIEEYLDGVEVTVLAFTDGKTVVTMPACTDHKRALDGDKGLNTGGMGVVAPVPYYTAEIAAECMKTIFQPTIDGMRAEGTPFKGCIYFGLMLSSRGTRVIEYNCRFGDPETQVILPLLETDFMDIIEAVWDERLSEIDVRFSNSAAACVVIASGGYPEKYETGYEITGLDNADNALIFHAGTKLSIINCQSSIVSAGGRVLGVVGVSDNLPAALDKAYSAVGKINFTGAHYRTDIGRKACLPSS